MKALIRIIPLLLVCIQCSCISCKDSTEEPGVSANGEPIRSFALVDSQNREKRIEFVINHTTKLIEGQIPSGLDISNYVMDYELVPGVESLTPSGLPMPSNKLLILRSEFDNADFKYTIKMVVQVVPAKS